jgi:hypothetical protein
MELLLYHKLMMSTVSNSDWGEGKGEGEGEI